MAIRQATDVMTRQPKHGLEQLHAVRIVFDDQDSGHRGLGAKGCI
jgi:hypothetical protein